MFDISHKLAQEKRKSRIFAELNSGGLIKTVESTSPSETVADKVAAVTGKVTHEVGIIEAVMPLGDNMLVAVGKTSCEDSEIGAEPLLYNSFGLGKEEVPLLSVLIPLKGVNQKFSDIDPVKLYHAPVEVEIVDGIANFATIIAPQTYAMTHESNIRRVDIKEAAEHNIPVDDYLEYLGYDRKYIDDYLKIKTVEFKNFKVLRFKDEAYYDKDTSNPYAEDIYIGESPAYIIGRNYLKMKDKLCHMPCIMFSGR